MPGPYREAEEVTAALRRSDVRPHLQATLKRYERGEVSIPPRGSVGLQADGSVTHIMTARDLAERLVLTKVVDYDPGRPRRDGRAASAGILSLLHDGHPVLVTSADLFTGIRTGITAAFSIDLLSPAGELEVALLGPGLVGAETLRALARLRALSGVRLVGRDRDSAITTAQRLRAELDVPVEELGTVRDACQGASVLVTATSAVEPVVDADDLAPEVEVVAALGAGIAERRELTAAAVASCEHVFVDTSQGAEEEAGDLIQAAREGVAVEARSLTEAFDGLRLTGRRLYKSVGSPWQDLACIHAVLDVLDPDWKSHVMPGHASLR